MKSCQKTLKGATSIFDVAGDSEPQKIIAAKKGLEDLHLKFCSDCQKTCLKQKDENLIKGLLAERFSEIDDLVKNRARLREFLKQGNLKSVVSEVSVNCDKSEMCLVSLEAMHLTLEAFLHKATFDCFALSPARNCKESCIVSLLLCDQLKEAQKLKKNAFLGQEFVIGTIRDQITDGEKAQYLGKGVFDLSKVCCLEETKIEMLPHNANMLKSVILEAKEFRKKHHHWKLEEFPGSIRVLLRVFDPPKVVIVGKKNQDVWFLWSGKVNRRKEFRVITLQNAEPKKIDLTNHCVCSDASSIFTP